MSATEIDKGTRWSCEEIAAALDITMTTGIICLTPENLKEEWLLFETGAALAKTRDPKTRVWTYLLAGLEPQHLKDPLRMFQATKPDEEDTRKLVQSINKNLDGTIQEDRVNRSFAKFWPDLNQQLQAIAALSAEVPPKPDTNEMIEETLELVRAAARSRKVIEDLDQYIPVFKQFMPILEQLLRAPAMTHTPTAASSGVSDPNQNMLSNPWTTPGRKSAAAQPSMPPPPRRTFLVKLLGDNTPKRAEGTDVARDYEGALLVIDGPAGTYTKFTNVEQVSELGNAEATVAVQQAPTPAEATPPNAGAVPLQTKKPHMFGRRKHVAPSPKDKP